MTKGDKYLNILKQYWGYDSFRGIQRDIIESIGKGKDTLGLMPTGGGKSITFQVPALAIEGVCIVITPLIALMKDQVEHLRKNGIKAYAIYSSLHHNEIVKILDNAVLGGVTLLYISPERLASEFFQTKLRHMQVSFITVDEAHCICQWGYDFRPSYLEIAKIRKIKPNTPVLALTATATKPSIDDIQKQLNFKESNVFRMSFSRKNLAYIVRETGDKLAEAAHIIRSVSGSAIVYVYSRQKTKEVAEYLSANGISATFYHAGLEHATRDERQTLWQQDKVKVIVATNAFGMGIDKPDVRVVIHIDCTDSIEAYFQEAGRAGRDGQKAYAILLFNANDKVTLNRRIADNFPDKEYIRTVYENLAYFFQLATGSGFGHTFEFNSAKFCMYFKHFPIRMNAALHILDKAGYIRYSEEADNKARMRFLVSRNELYILNELTDKENAVITAALRTYCGLFADYVFIDEAIIAHQSNIDEHEVYQILKGLSKKHIISFIPQKKIPQIKYVQNRVDKEEIIIPKQVYELRKKLYKERIEAMLAYAENKTVCRSRQLLRYFGETNSCDCGQCDVCIEHKKKNATDKRKDTEIHTAILNMLSDNKEHEITEIYNLNYNMADIDRVLIDMALEEKILNNDGKIIAHFK